MSLVTFGVQLCRYSPSLPDGLEHKRRTNGQGTAEPRSTSSRGEEWSAGSGISGKDKKRQNKTRTKREER